MNNAEQIIKDTLDGLFFSLNIESGKVRAFEVPKDFIPNHKPKTIDIDEDTRTSARDWSPGEDETILRMYAQGICFSNIGRHLGVAKSTVWKRFAQLCETIGGPPKRIHPLSKHGHLDDTIAELKAQGLTFTQIGERVGMTRNQVSGVWARLRKQMERQAA